MTESTSEHVECPICGDGFDPTAAGGWCTNPNCGEWQYLGDEVPEPAETAPADGTAAEEAVDPGAGDDPMDEWIDPPTETGPESADEEATAATSGASESTGGDADAESAAGRTDDAGAGSTDEPTDDTGDNSAEDLTLEFGTAPGDAGDEAAEDSSTEDATAEAGQESETDEETAVATCPDCGADVGDTDAFCAACGADLESGGAAEAASGAEAPDRLALLARGEEVLVSPDQTVGREIRRIVTDTGGDEDEAVRIHREHVRFVREDGRFYVVDLGDNPTRVNDQYLQKGEREPVGPGDDLNLAGVVTLTVDRLAKGIS